MGEIEKLLNHSIYLARLENQGLRTFITPSLAETLRDVRRLIADLDDITNLRQLLALERAIKRTIEGQTGWAALESELFDVAQYENEFIANWSGLADAAPNETVERLANSTFMVLRSGDQFDSGLWRTFVDANIENQARQVNNIVRAAYATGAPARLVRQQISNLYDGVLSRHAETLLRTGYQHYAQVGRRAFIQANRDVIGKEVPLVVFDSRTSDVCISVAARYGKKGWPAGDSPVGYPPYHYRCRTQILPLGKDEELDGKRTARGAEGGKQINADTTIDAFVRSQPRAWQDELLGPRRAELFRKGEIELRNLTNAQLEPLTLPEIVDLEG